MTPLALVALLLVIISTAHGALRTWDGEGADNFWMTGANWGGDVAPSPGDDLLFPSGALRLVNSNNFAVGTIFNSVMFAGGGYSLRGSLVSLNAGVTNLAGVNSLRFPISLGNNQAFSVTAGFLGTDANIDTAGRTLNLHTAGQAEIQIRSPISGTGGITKTGAGFLTIAANDSYLGPTEILAGSVTLLHSNGLGLATAGTTLSAGAVLVLDAVTVPEPLVLGGQTGGFIHRWKFSLVGAHHVGV